MKTKSQTNKAAGKKKLPYLSNKVSWEQQEH